MRPIEETTVLITGATDGLGRGVARDLAARGANVLLHGRSRERLDELSAELGDAPTFQADFASLEEVRRLAAEVEQSTDALHVLINNAGIGGGAPDGTTRQESKDGHELRLAVNHLAGFLLTLRLLPLLRRSKPAPMLDRGYSGSRAYGQSKLAQITTGFELAERLDPDEVTVTSLHPSTYMPTKMVLEARGSSVDTLEAGIEATSRLAIDPELEGVTGRFYDRQRESTPDPQASDPEQRKRLWALSLELVGEPEPAP
jgi:NAD(P)-dependent dehydrogenase (short-subunit alcohol dehydrogenase family)